MQPTPAKQTTSLVKITTTPGATTTASSSSSSTPLTTTLSQNTTEDKQQINYRITTKAETETEDPKRRQSSGDNSKRIVVASSQSSSPEAAAAVPVGSSQVRANSPSSCLEESADRPQHQQRQQQHCQVGSKQLRNYTAQQTKTTTTTSHLPSSTTSTALTQQHKTPISTPTTIPCEARDTASSVICSSYSCSSSSVVASCISGSSGNKRTPETATPSVVLEVTGEGKSCGISSDSIIIDSGHSNTTKNTNTNTNNNSNSNNRNVYRPRIKQNSSSSSITSLDQACCPVEQLESSSSSFKQNTLVDQRIKVTLSAPRNSSDNIASLTSEPILIDSTSNSRQPVPLVPAIVTSAAGSIGSSSGSSVGGKRRQSTATLISAFDTSSGSGEAAGSSGYNTRQQELRDNTGDTIRDNYHQASGSVVAGVIIPTVQIPAPSQHHTSIPTVTLSRSEQEQELRRIASQRLKRKQQVSGSPIDSSVAVTSTELGGQINSTTSDSTQQQINNNKLTRKATNPAINQTTIKPSTTLKPQQQQQLLASPEQQNPKQLAIYINGKIRSNSIFCRSNSNNSFNGILHKFHVSNNNNNNNNSSDQANNNKSGGQSSGEPGHQQSSGSSRKSRKSSSSPLKLCRHSRGSKESRKNHHRSTKRQQSSTSATATAAAAATAAAGRQLPGGHFGANLCQNFHKLLTNYHLTPAKSTEPICKSPLEAASDSRRSTGFSREEEGEANKVNQRQSSAGKDKLVKSSSLVFGFDSKSDSNSTSISIEDDDNNNEQQEEEHVSSYKLNPSSMFLRKAMRYYRLWIYCTNITILIGTLIFILSAIYVMSDYRIKLLVSPQPTTTTTLASHTNSQNQRGLLDQKPETSLGNPMMLDGYNGENRKPDLESPEVTSSSGVIDSSDAGIEYSISISYTEPYLILAYVVIAIQAGLLQAIGCFGAIRMKERWIQAFYYLILALIALDIMLLTGWLNRYDYIVKSLHDHMSLRLREHYGTLSNENLKANNNETSQKQLSSSTLSNRHNLISVTQEMNSKLDKILTEIIDKIQADSKCCGITSSLDYKYSYWRKIKLEKLKMDLNWTDSRKQDSNPNIAHLMSVVPLVPASCCRRSSKTIAAAARPNSNGLRLARPVILDDSQIERPNRIPAWSPSMVVENLMQQTANAKDRAPGNGSGDKAAHYGQQQQRQPPSDYGYGSPNDDDGSGDSVISPSTLADLIDGRWSLPAENVGGKLERRLLAKQENFRRPTLASSSQMPYDDNYDDEKEDDDDDTTIGHKRKRRWTVESMVDNEERVLTRLIEDDDDDDDDDSGNGDLLPDEPPSGGSSDDKWELSPSWSLEELEDGQEVEAADSEGRSFDEAKSVGSNSGSLNNNNNNSFKTKIGTKNAASKRNNNKTSQQLRASQQLNKLRQILFKPLMPQEVQVQAAAAAAAAAGWCEMMNANASCYAPNQFRWPNKLQLSFDQYKTIESYLLREIREEEQEKEETEQEVESGKPALGKRGQASDLVKVDDPSTTQEAINFIAHGSSSSPSAAAAGSPRSRRHSTQTKEAQAKAQIQLDNNQRQQLTGMKDDAAASAAPDDNDKALDRRGDKLPARPDLECASNKSECRRKLASKQLVRMTKSVVSGGDDAAAAAAAAAGEIDGLSSNIPSNLQHQRNHHQKQQQQQQQQNSKEELRLLKEILLADPETSCAPRSYYDLETIYTRGCYPDIKSWLDSSAHILFVTGFCILTVLKFCSVVLLRLEIREMIHKIRVLKGMATEYNALHDLEAYLPRPSVCAEAAELTPSGVALTANVGSGGGGGLCPPGSANISPANNATNSIPFGFTTNNQAPGGAKGGSLSNTGGFPAMGQVHRLGGSFSEAVAAATAAAHGGSAHAGSGLGLGGLASSGRAASMKAVAAMSNMLTPTSLCPRSSSASAAHLQAAATLLSGSQQAGGTAGLSLRPDPFQMAAASNGMMMSRRHTAVSVCPAAAAAAAAAAAHHLMSRRGTYVANPMFGPPPNLMMMSASGSNLFQHRHSAHTVSSLLTRPQQQQTGNRSQQQQQQQQHASKRSSRHYLCDTPSGGPTIEHQSSGESSQLTTATTNSGACCGQPAKARNSSGGSGHQLLSLVYPFKRQSSGGAQSAGNFSLDLAPALLTESRRSIH